MTMRIDDLAARYGDSGYDRIIVAKILTVRNHAITKQHYCTTSRNAIQHTSTSSTMVLVLVQIYHKLHAVVN